MPALAYSASFNWAKSLFKASANYVLSTNSRSEQQRVSLHGIDPDQIFSFDT